MKIKFLLISLILVVNNVFALVISQFDSEINVRKDIQYYKTKEQNETWNQILDKTQNFDSLSNYKTQLLPGYIHWIVIPFTYQGYAAREFVLETGVYWAQSISFYFVNENDSIVRYCASSNSDGPQWRDIDFRSFSFKFKPEQEQDYKLILRLENKLPIKPKLQIFTIEQHKFWIENQQYVQSLFVNFLLILSIVSILFIVLYKRLEPLWLSLFLTASLVFYTIELGFVSFGIEYFYYSDLQLPKSLSNSIIGMFLFYLIYSLVDFGQNNGGKSFTLWDIIAWLGAVSSIAIFYIDADWIALSNALVYFGLLRMMYKTILLASKHRFQPRIIYFILMLSFLPFFLVSTYYIFIDSKFTYIYEVATTFQVLILMALVVYKRSKLEEQYFENELNRLRESFYREPKNTDEKYKSSKYSEQEVEKCYETVVARLKTDKLYLDPELNMLKLSQELGFPSHLLSQAINQKEGKNFFDFINTYRVEEAKSMLSNLKFNHHSVEGIGYECGFNTKATFYSTFKKQTGETPAEYKKRHQKL